MPIQRLRPDLVPARVRQALELVVQALEPERDHAALLDAAASNDLVLEELAEISERAHDLLLGVFHDGRPLTAGVSLVPASGPFDPVSAAAAELPSRPCRPSSPATCARRRRRSL